MREPCKAFVFGGRSQLKANLKMNRLTTEKRTQAVACLVDGNSQVQEPGEAPETARQYATITREGRVETRLYCAKTGRIIRVGGRI